jgi:hypothetical protein
MELTTGEKLKFDFDAVVPSAVSFHRGIACVDTICAIRHNGRVGYGCFETSNNALHGGERPLRAINGGLENGWHSAQPEEILAILPDA